MCQSGVEVGGYLTPLPDLLRGEGERGWREGMWEGLSRKEDSEQNTKSMSKKIIFRITNFRQEESKSISCLWGRGEGIGGFQRGN